MDLQIKGLRVLVTAGAAGIGLETVRAFLREGAKVHVCDVDEAALAALRKSHPEVTASSTDVSDRAAVAKLFDDALATLECRLAEQTAVATHYVFMAEVVSGAARAGTPLAYFRGQFGRLELTQDQLGSD
jgi:NAD(P)-dependent dehydrogenase (short-subunit alcohol dehydrogenase family)